jgi:hypothetical protein
MTFDRRKSDFNGQRYYSLKKKMPICVRSITHKNQIRICVEYTLIIFNPDLLIYLTSGSRIPICYLSYPLLLLQHLE